MKGNIKKPYLVPEIKDYGTLKEVTAAGTCFCKTICLINCYPSSDTHSGYPDGGGTCPREATPA